MLLLVECEKMSTFGQRIKQLRESHHLTQKLLAEKLSINRDALAKWETDKAYPDIHIIKGIANFFGVSIDYLLDNCDSFEIQLIELLRRNRNLMNKEEQLFLYEMIKNYIETLRNKKAGT
jgi:transcriptional regulator with XRE-family HTH domain